MKEFVVKFPLGTPLEPICRKAEELGYGRGDANPSRDRDCFLLRTYEHGKYSLLNHKNLTRTLEIITLETFMKMNKLTNKYVKVPHNMALKEAVLKHAENLGLELGSGYEYEDDSLCFSKAVTGWGFFSDTELHESEIPIYDFFALTKEDINPEPQQTRLSVEEIKKKLGIEGDLIVEE